MRNDAPSDKLRRVNLRDILVTSQIALSVVLLIGSVLVVRSLQHALSLHLGFEPRHAAALSFDLGLEGYNEERTREFQRRLLDKVRSMPAIEAAGMIDGLPLTLNISNSTIFLEGTPAPRPGDAPSANMYQITPGYLQAMQTRLLAGRDLDQRDSQDTPLVVLVNEAFARRSYPLPGEGSAVGKRFPLRHHREMEAHRRRRGGWEIPLSRRNSIAHGFRRHAAGVAKQCQTLVARSPLAEAETSPSMLRRAVAELDPSVTIYDAGSLTSELALALFPARLVAVVLASFGLLAAVLAATGVYGIMAYAVSRRTREIGIRMALGAASSEVLRVVLNRTAVLIGLGAVLGSGIALAAGTFFGQILYGVSARDPLTYICAIALMAAVALIACWVPARRAIRVDPLTALRTE